MDYELTLIDRLGVIKSVNEKYDLEHNAYLSFSGGKDSTILHYLLDIALPNNRIPRVFIDTGIEYQMIRDFVLTMAKNDDRFVIIKPSKPIKQTLEQVGYPFKSKQHSHNVAFYQQNPQRFEEIRKVIDSDTKLLTDYNFIHALPIGVKTLVKYYYGVRERERESCISTLTVPKLLRYQLENKCDIKISDSCCRELKKKPIHKWEKENNRFVALTGMRKEEGGTRKLINGCVLTDDKGNLKKFHPLLVVEDEWENDFVKNNKVELCKLYDPPCNFRRTGCAGCPFSLDLEEQLEIMEKYIPNQRRQCEFIWKPVYDEYRRLNYRLKNVETIKLF